MSDRAIHPDTGGARRWTASLVVVLAVHAASGAGLLAWHAPAESPSAPPAAVMIDLAPLLPPPARPEPLPEPVAEPEPLTEVEPPEPEPEPVVALPPPKAKPKPPVRKQAEPRPPSPQPVPQTAAQWSEAPPASPAPSPAASAPAAPSGAVRSWQGEVLAHLARHKRYPRAARMARQEGVAHVRFVIDRQGRVVSFHLEKSSGVASLDEETLALVERADPLPAPPADMGQARIELVAPVIYAIK